MQTQINLSQNSTFAAALQKTENRKGIYSVWLCFITRLIETEDT